MKVKKNYLLLLAGIVWLAAGFNILRIGIVSYKEYVTVFNLLFSIAIFAAFWFMVFGKLVKKHTARIVRYKEERQFFLKFFDRRSFIIMAVMMTCGISLRAFHLCPELCIAVFYSGLGTALVLAGLAFTNNYILQAVGKGRDRAPRDRTFRKCGT